MLTEGLADSRQWGLNVRWLHGAAKNAPWLEKLKEKPNSCAMATWRNSVHVRWLHGEAQLNKYT